MELKISNCNSFFKIKGSLNKNSLPLFLNEFEDIFERFNVLTISIEDVYNMDKDGVNALSNLHKESIDKHKSLSIIGLGCEDLYNHFKSVKAA